MASDTGTANERRARRVTVLAWRVALLIVLAGAAVWVVVFAQTRSEPPARCPPGWEPRDPRCCAAGQIAREGHCEGAPLACPAGFLRRDDGCVAKPRRVRIPPGKVRIGPGDWEAQGVVRPALVSVEAPFWIDVHEVTVDRWRACEAAGACSRLAADEPGRAARGMTFDQASSFCAWAGGAIPELPQWQIAAAGTAARRYPWGDTGAVCRRGSWGLKTGPCGVGANGPETAGIHADGASPEGVFDLAGGVAEWVALPRGGAVVCGGSWTTSLATGLRTWHTEQRDPKAAFDDVGLRCVYASGDGA